MDKYRQGVAYPLQQLRDALILGLFLYLPQTYGVTMTEHYFVGANGALEIAIRQNDRAAIAAAAQALIPNTRWAPL